MGHAHTERGLRKAPHSCYYLCQKESWARVPTQNSFSSLGKVCFLCQHRKGCPSLESVPTTHECGKSFLAHNHCYTLCIGAVLPYKAREMGQNPLLPPRNVLALHANSSTCHVGTCGGFTDWANQARKPFSPLGETAGRVWGCCSPPSSC